MDKIKLAEPILSYGLAFLLLGETNMDKRIMSIKGRKKLSLARMGDKNHQFIDGRTLKKHYCKICGKEIGWMAAIHGTGLCHLCYCKTGRSHYLDGRSLIKPKCVDCGKELAEYRAKRCQSCETIKRYKNGILSITPNKPEKILINLLKNKFKYIGDGAIWIGGFNPDFINSKQNKIIELYGDYWHNRKDAKERDKLRIPTYKKYGYKTLIIWETEFKNLNKMINKIRSFYYGK
jgi:G:T-mismatch repair DNA endonuclease (very short patch repair protein)